MPLARSIDLAALEFAARFLQFARHPREGVEPADRHVEDRLDTLLAQPVDDIGGHAGFDGGLDGGRSERSTNMAIGRFTARDSWNMFSSMSRLGFSRSMTMTSGSISAIRRAMPATSWMTVTCSCPASRSPASMIAARMRFSSMTRTRETSNHGAFCACADCAMRHSSPLAGAGAAPAIRRVRRATAWS